MKLSAGMLSLAVDITLKTKKEKERNDRCHMGAGGIEFANTCEMPSGDIQGEKMQQKLYRRVGTEAMIVHVNQFNILI